MLRFCKGTMAHFSISVLLFPRLWLAHHGSPRHEMLRLSGEKVWKAAPASEMRKETGIALQI